MITMKDLRKLGYCALGVRRVFNNSGLDFRTFLREGIELEALSVVDDHYYQEIKEAYGKREQ